MRFEDDDGVLVSISPAVRVHFLQLMRSTDRGRGRAHGYEIRVHLDGRGEDWSDFELYYQDRDRALAVLAQFEELFAAS